MNENLDAPGRASRRSGPARSSHRAGTADLDTAQAAPSTEQEPPFRSVAFTISTTGYALRRRFHELLKPLGIDPQELGLLQALATEEGVTQQAIADQIKVVPSRMTVLVDSLEERGLLERRQKRDDRRARALYLTDQGRELLGRGFAVALEHEQLVTTDLSKDEREQLLALLSRVGAHVGIPAGVHAGMGHSALLDQ